MKPRLIVRELGLQDYTPVWHGMQQFTAARTIESPDELWVLSHPPVFTQGQAGKAEHVLAAGDIPVVQIDRGGQVTYHGPGQLVVYVLIDVRRAGMGVRELVSALENAIIATLSQFGLAALTRQGAPGVYLEDAKIASLGLRIRNGCSYHGLSLNVAMDLEPFARINPCGFQGMAVTQVGDHVKAADGLMEDVKKRLVQELVDRLGPYAQLDVHHSLPNSH
jgi:lipoyl(octanoyl) transferase